MFKIQNYYNYELKYLLSFWINLNSSLRNRSTAYLKKKKNLLTPIFLTFVCVCVI